MTEAESLVAAAILFIVGFGAGGLWLLSQTAGWIVFVGELIVGPPCCILYGLSKTWRPDWGLRELIGLIWYGGVAFVAFGSCAALGFCCGTWLWRVVGRTLRSRVEP